jgi:fimbrial chaperone protein
MWPDKHGLIARWLLAVGTAAAAAAANAGVLISPVVVEVASARRPVAVSVTNDGDRPVTYQTDALAWQQVDGADHFESTDELLVVPPIVEVPAKGSQVFRVMLRSRAPSPVERSYRLVLEDITEAAAPAAGQAAITFRLSHSLPVMIAPAGKVLNALRWKPCAGDAAAQPRALCVRMLNAGNRRVKFKTLTVAGEGWREVLSLGAGENVLAGAQREWLVPFASGQSRDVRSVEIETGRGETLQAEGGDF